MEQEEERNGRFIEKHVFGEKTSLRCIRANDQDERDWLDGQPVCQALNGYEMLHLGVMNAQRPYEVVRVFQGGAFFLVTLAGAGRVLIDGEWQDCHRGEGCLLPAYTTNAFHCASDEGWNFCWVRYKHPDQQIPLIQSNQPIVAKFCVEQFHLAILGLLTEVENENRIQITEQWIQLVHSYVRDFIAPHGADERLWRLWTQIDRDLAHQWTLEHMSRIAALSAEHLRRLCKAEHGRSPIEQVRWLRMQRAATLLISTGDKIASVAYEVGYKNPVVFSAAFKKQFNMQPSQYRQQHI